MLPKTRSANKLQAILKDVATEGNFQVYDAPPPEADTEEAAAPASDHEDRDEDGSSTAISPTEESQPADIPEAAEGDESVGADPVPPPSPPPPPPPAETSSDESTSDDSIDEDWQRRVAWGGGSSSKRSNAKSSQCDSRRMGSMPQSTASTSQSRRNKAIATPYSQCDFETTDHDFGTSYARDQTRRRPNDRVEPSKWGVGEHMWYRVFAKQLFDSNERRNFEATQKEINEYYVPAVFSQWLNRPDVTALRNELVLDPLWSLVPEDYSDAILRCLGPTDEEDIDLPPYEMEALSAASGGSTGRRRGGIVFNAVCHGYVWAHRNALIPKPPQRGLYILPEVVACYAVERLMPFRHRTTALRMLRRLFLSEEIRFTVDKYFRLPLNWTDERIQNIAVQHFLPKGFDLNILFMSEETTIRFSRKQARNELRSAMYQQLYRNGYTICSPEDAQLESMSLYCLYIYSNANAT